LTVPELRIVTTASGGDVRRHEKGGVVAAAMLIGAASMLVLGMEPILLGGLAEAGRLNGVGQAAMSNSFGLALGSTAGPFVMNAGHMRAKRGPTLRSIVISQRKDHESLL